MRCNSWRSTKQRRQRRVASYSVPGVSLRCVMLIAATALDCAAVCCPAAASLPAGQHRAP